MIKVGLEDYGPIVNFNRFTLDEELNMKCKSIRCLAWAFALIGAINWGLMGEFNFNLVTYFAHMTPEPALFTRVAYLLVGFSGLYLLAMRVCYGDLMQAE